MPYINGTMQAVVGQTVKPMEQQFPQICGILAGTCVSWTVQGDLDRRIYAKNRCFSALAIGAMPRPV
jgi:hypothetical protein